MQPAVTDMQHFLRFGFLTPEHLLEDLLVELGLPEICRAVNLRDILIAAFPEELFNLPG